MVTSIRGLLSAFALLGFTSFANAAVIGFDGIGAHGAQFTSYTEDGFTVSAGSSLWTNNRVYGAPLPFVQYVRNQSDPELVTGLFFTAGDADFTFASVDVYSSVTPIPYRIRGFQDGLVLFDLQGTVPNTFGQFRTILNPELGDVIDRLYIQLFNPFVACCSNPVGMDNIVVSLVSTVPEPGVLLLLATSMVLLAGLSKRRPNITRP